MKCEADRILAFDALKGVGICCVLLGHDISWGTPLSKCLFSFHIPLFFFVSGILFKPNLFSGFGAVARRALVHMVFPYFFFTAIGLLFWPFRQVEFPSALKFFGRIFYSFHPHSNGPVWFLMSLAIVQCLCYLGRRHLAKAWVVIAIFFLSLGSIIGALPTPMVRCLPFKMGAVAFGGGYFLLGHCSRQWARHFFANEFRSCRKDGMVALVFLFLLCLLQHFSHGGHIGIPSVGDAVFFPMSACGILCVFYCVRGFSLDCVRPLTFIGRNSLYYFTLDFCSLPIVLLILHWILPAPMTCVKMSVTTCNHGLGLGAVIFVMNLCGVTLLMLAIRPFYVWLRTLFDTMMEKICRK